LCPAGSHDANVAMARKVAASLADDHRRCGDCLWIRSERQTFMRLPQTMALAFGIHTYSDPLSSLANDRESLAALHRLLGAYTEERLSYSAMLDLRDPVLRWIEDRLAVTDG
ncbi:MAG: heme-dependent oxidative N-demethylase subunit alpha family protein, partial [Aestuariivirga sp.]